MRKQAFALGVGAFVYASVGFTYNAFMPLFYRNFLSNLALIGFLMTIDNIMAVTIQPLWGARSDRTWTRIGRRLPYVLSGLLLSAFCILFLPFAAQVSLTVLVSAAILFNLAISISNVPYNALLADLFPPNFRSKAAGAVVLMGTLGALVAVVGGGKLFGVSSMYPFIAASAGLCVAVIVLGFIVKEPKQADIHVTTRPQDAPQSLLTLIRWLVAMPEKSALLFLASMFCMHIPWSGTNTWFTTYARDGLGLAAGNAAQLFGFALAGTLISAIPSGFAGARFGRKRVVLASILLLIPIYGAFIFAQNSIIAGILLGLMGLCGTLAAVNSVVMAQEFASPQQVGAFTGLFILSTEASKIVGPPLIGALMNVFGPRALWGVGVIALTLSALLISRVREGHPRPVDQPVPIPAAGFN
jgi:maltose/moltooligosaccharide transporter